MVRSNGHYPPAECIVAPAPAPPVKNQGRSDPLSLGIAILALLVSLYTLSRITIYTEATRRLTEALDRNTEAFGFVKGVGHAPVDHRQAEPTKSRN